MKDLLLKLEKERKRLGVTQKDMAAAGNISQSYYSEAVDGKKAGLTLDSFVLMAEKVGFVVTLSV